MSIQEEIIVNLIAAKARNRADFRRVVASVYRDDNTSGYHSNIELRMTYNAMVAAGDLEPDESLEKLLVTKKMRSLSGVSVITVLTKPYACPGKCIYCPSVADVPKSYLPDEPAVMRAILADYDPRKQIETRLQSLTRQGHPVDKVELIIIGGTFSHLPRDYQEEFVKGCFDALNGENSADLSEAKKRNETASSRCVGLTLETRPDHITLDEVKWFRYLGATRVELGVQTVFDEVLKANGRGEKVTDTVGATKLLRDAGFKICYHLMPNLYGSNLQMDKIMFQTIFDDPRFRPDYIKIYPCMVLKNTPLYDLWKRGEYKSYTDDELIDLICDLKKHVPYWVRIMRTIRDIPAVNIESGSKLSNMRQVILAKAETEGWRCHCIRCREIGAGTPTSLSSLVTNPGISSGPTEGDPRIRKDDKVVMIVEKYEASEGIEYFLSYEDENRQNLYSLLRLRLPTPVIPAKAGIQENDESGSQIKFGMTIKELAGCALIREVHTYGQEVEIGESGKTQHQGYGRKLLAKAERIAYENGYTRLAVIAGIGVREYYRKFGYELVGEYMIKTLDLKPKI